MIDHNRILTKHNIPLPGGYIESLRYITRFSDWYAMINGAWYWFDNVDKCFAFIEKVPESFNIRQNLDQAGKWSALALHAKQEK